MADRYDTTRHPEAQYEPGSGDRVLRNRLGITDPVRMEELEFDLLVNLQARLLGEVEIRQTITADDLCGWHHRWLGEVYAWAGAYRQVNMSKGEFPFAAAHLLEKLMWNYERDCLRRFTPCAGMNKAALREALAVCHVELLVIHPFREGNGRLARVLSTIMALQAGQPLLDFSVLEQDKAKYIAAIHAGHAGDSLPMQKVFAEVLEHSGA